MEGLQKISRNADNGIAYDNARGSALFFRSWSFYQLAQAFAPLHNKATAATDLGIPLRLSADVNTPSIRASLEATYKQVLGDLKASVALLPVTPAFKTRLSKPAAYALLARVYLSMQDYPDAGLYADSCLALYHTLLDYNMLDASSNIPVPRFNEEMLFASLVQDPPNNELYRASLVRIDTALYASYDDNDLRKTLFFRPRDNAGTLSKAATTALRYPLWALRCTKYILPR